MVQLLIGDWSVVGGVGGDDSAGVHHVLTGQVGLAHLPQAEWTESESRSCLTHVKGRVHACQVPLQLELGQLSSCSLLSHHGGRLVPLHKQTCQSVKQNVAEEEGFIWLKQKHICDH